MADYLPYIRVQDLSSIGQSNRDFGETTGRQHDFLTKLEHRVFLLFDHSGLLDIKEQYPLSLELTLEIARQCGIKHPADPRTKEPKPLITNLLLTIPLPIGSKRAARAIHYSTNLGRRRIEILELERRSWRSLDTDWGLITERDINPNIIRGLLWTYKFRQIDSLYPLSPNDITSASQVLTKAVLAGNSPLCETALRCDQLLGFSNGSCLRLARHLIASRQWRVDMSVPLVTTVRLRLLDTSVSLD